MEETGIAVANIVWGHKDTCKTNTHILLLPSKKTIFSTMELYLGQTGQLFLLSLDLVLCPRTTTPTKILPFYDLREKQGTTIYQRTTEQPKDAMCILNMSYKTLPKGANHNLWGEQWME